MLSLEQNLRRSKRGPTIHLGGAAISAVVFTGMGLMQFNIDFPQPEALEPISEFHLPPPPPPPERDPPPHQTNVSISFNVPVTDGPAEIPIGFLDVDFGLTPKTFTQTNVSVDASLDNYKTDGLESLKIYSHDEVTEKPKRAFQGALDIPSKLQRLVGEKPITVVVLYVVTDKGRTTNVHVLDCPFPELVPYFEKYISEWRLKPAVKDGRPVNCWVQHKFTYRAGPTDPYSL